MTLPKLLNTGNDGIKRLGTVFLCHCEVAAGRLGFSRGEAGITIGSSEPIGMTDVESGRQPGLIATV